MKPSNWINCPVICNVEQTTVHLLSNIITGSETQLIYLCAFLHLLQVGTLGLKYYSNHYSVLKYQHLGIGPQMCE